MLPGKYLLHRPRCHDCAVSSILFYLKNFYTALPIQADDCALARQYIFGRGGAFKVAFRKSENTKFNEVDLRVKACFGFFLAGGKCCARRIFFFRTLKAGRGHKEHEEPLKSPRTLSRCVMLRPDKSLTPVRPDSDLVE